MPFNNAARHAARCSFRAAVGKQLYFAPLHAVFPQPHSSLLRRFSSTVRQAEPLTSVAAAVARLNEFPAGDAETLPPVDMEKVKRQSTLAAYMELSKARLSALVVLTSGAGFMLAGLPIDWVTCAATVTGTSLAAAAANTFNQVYEIRTDGMMMRTQRRPLPTGRLQRADAIRFGIAAASASAAVLWFGTNPLTTALGIGNIVLYAAVYTPLKQMTTLNTAVGAVVGAIPPLMGWAAATGSLMALDPLLLGYILFAWQFPHFYALAWLARKDYARGGYFMVPVFDQAGTKTGRLIVRHALGLCLVPVVATALGVTSPMFMVDATVLNGYLLYLARKFKANPSDAAARSIFRTSLWYLPVLMALMVFHASMWNTKEQQLAAKLQQLAPVAEEGVAVQTSTEAVAPASGRGVGIGEGVEHAITCGRLVGRAWCAHELVVNAGLGWAPGRSSSGSSGSGASSTEGGGRAASSGGSSCPIPLPSSLKHQHQHQADEGATHTNHHGPTSAAAMMCPVKAVEHGAAKVGEAMSDAMPHGTGRSLGAGGQGQGQARTTEGGSAPA